MNEAALFHQIRMLKGARLSILLILQHAQRPLTGIELQQATGYTDKPVRTALAWLSRNRMAISAGRQTGWILGPKPPPFLTLSPIAPEMDGQIQPAGLAATTDGAYGRYDPYGEAAAISSATSAPAKERPGIYNQGLDPIEDGAELVAGDYGDRRNSEHPSQDRKNPDLPDRRNSDHDLSDRKKSAFVDRRNSDLAGSDRKNSDRGSENFRSTADLISSDLIDLTDDDDDLHHHHRSDPSSSRSRARKIAIGKNPIWLISCTSCAFANPLTAAFYNTTKRTNCWPGIGKGG